MDRDTFRPGKGSCGLLKAGRSLSSVVCVKKQPTEGHPYCLYTPFRPKFNRLTALALRRFEADKLLLQPDSASPWAHARLCCAACDLLNRRQRGRLILDLIRYRGLTDVGFRVSSGRARRGGGETFRSGIPSSTLPRRRSSLGAILSMPARRGLERLVGFTRERVWVMVFLLASLALFLWGWGYLTILKATPGADALWEQAEQEFKAARYEKVERTLGRLRQLREPTPLDWLLRAQLALVQNHPDEALADLSRVPDDHYMAPQARLLAGQLELRRDRVRFAELALREAVRLSPDLVQAHRELIYIYGMQLRRKEISREFLALSQLVDLTFDNAFHWCLLRNNVWEAREVVQSLSRYVAADPQDRWSRLAIAENFRRMGQHAEAERTLAPLPREDPEANVIRIQIAVDSQDRQCAEELLALGRDDDPELARLRGREALARRDAQGALRYFRIAYAADPDNGEVVRGLYSTLELLGKTEEAGPLRERARNLDVLNKLILRVDTGSNRKAQRDADLMRQLGAVCAALNRTAEARTWLKLAIARDPLDAEAQKALFRLGRASGQPRSPRLTP
jgi:tetratricopeptide (TPR) repeat protein